MHLKLLLVLFLVIREVQMEGREVSLQPSASNDREDPSAAEVGCSTGRQRSCDSSKGQGQPIHVRLSLQTADSTTGNTSGRTCPPWFHSKLTNGSVECRCAGELNGMILCEDNSSETLILSCFCMTHDFTKNRTVVGECIYSCFRPGSLTSVHGNYHKLPSTISKINGDTCGFLHRAGQLCGNCMDSYSQPSYSYRLDCVKCSYDRWNWVKYVLVAYVPMTIFFAAVVSFRLSVASEQLNMFVLFAQLFSVPINARVLLAALKTNPNLTAVRRLAQTLFTVYGVWNLDFFRTLLSPICLGVSTLQMFSLDYIISIYSLVLILLTYGLNRMEQYNVRLVVWLCSPLRRCFVRIRRQWDIRTSTVEAFATFLVLFYGKVLSSSFSILIPTRVYDMEGHSRLFLYYNASIEYFGEEHCPYAIVALLVLIIFNVLPLLLLLLYPLRSFQRCLNCCGLQSFALIAFINVFYSHYKDGTNGTRDCRYFATVYFLMQFLYNITFILKLDTYIVVELVTLTIAGLMVAFKPYKSPCYNTINVILILSLALLCVSMTGIRIGLYSQNTPFNMFFLSLACVVAVIPVAYIVGLAVYWGLVHKQVPQACLRWIRRQWNGAALTPNFDGVYPDRVCNPQRYYGRALES